MPPVLLVLWSRSKSAGMVYSLSSVASGSGPVDSYLQSFILLIILSV